METGLAGKVVLITGATRNHGRASALAFARAFCWNASKRPSWTSWASRSTRSTSRSRSDRAPRFWSTVSSPTRTVLIWRWNCAAASLYCRRRVSAPAVNATAGASPIGARAVIAIALWQF